MATTPRSSEQQRTRFANASDFAELISQDVYVDVERLRFLSFHGIPDDRDNQTLRGTVWRILLPKLLSGFETISSVPVDNVAALSTATTNVETAKAIRDLLEQLDEPFFRKSSVRSKMEKVCIQYHADYPNGFASHDPKLLVYLYAPFMFTSRRSEPEHMFAMFMEMLERHNSFSIKERSFRRFMSLFRSQLPRLCAHFEEEELDPRKWVTGWHQCLFAKQLPFRCVLRLWDSYFSLRDGSFDLHLYVCLAVLKSFENDLLDKTYPELRAFMEAIPTLDIEKLVTQAQTLQFLE